MSIPHIAFYPSDWLAGTRGLSAEETGVYITLICRMYEMAGPIVRDEKRLARLCGCKSKAAFDRVLQYLIEEGKIIAFEDGLFNERVQKELEKVTKKSAKAQQAAQSRWDRKANKNNGGDDADASPKHMPQQCQSDTDTEEPKGSTPLNPPKGGKPKAKKKTSVTAKKPDEIPQQVWDDFLAVRKAKRAPLTETALNGICKEAAKANLTLSEALEICCKRGWQGFNADWIKPSDRPAQPPSKPQAKFIPVTQDSPLWDRVVDYTRTERAVYEANGDGKIWIPEAMHDFFNKNQIGCH